MFNLKEFDQCLDQIVVDAVPQGQFKFMFQVWLIYTKLRSRKTK